MCRVTNVPAEFLQSPIVPPWGCLVLARLRFHDLVLCHAPCRSPTGCIKECHRPPLQDQMRLQLAQVSMQCYCWPSDHMYSFNAYAYGQ